MAGGVILRGEQLLLVRNRRRNDSVEWSTPGGVVDPGETMLEALGREVREETGLRVHLWDGPLYRVIVDFADLGWRLRVETHRALDWDGRIVVEDPDGIVEHADFYDPDECEALLAQSPRWVHEPLLEWCRDRSDRVLSYCYRVTGLEARGLEVARL
ncbi:NUDIX hydrolase [Candidatus Poriferisocius sp.]|uniref:NUDIX hydrolase n=1 Tax=Candidatus Poriferisocius sp. TaxID=3101276 RepID=UPI003B0286F0